MGRLRLVFYLIPVLVFPIFARHQPGGCGTTHETANERLFLHRQSLRARTRASGSLLPRATAPAAARDIGEIAIIEDTDGVVARENEFNLDLKTLKFIPTVADASRYRYEVADQGYDASGATAGAALAALDDDDSRAVSLPFAFPFFGVTYSRVYVNSDGNLTFDTPDSASSDRSLGRMTAGAPRISPLFDDLDPSQTGGGVRVLSERTRVVVSWVAVPEWQTSGIGARQTFQVRLYPDGRIEFSYSSIRATGAVIGIAPGGLQGVTALIDFRNDPSATYSGAIAERFGNTLSVDIVTTAQKFYQTHEDSYDYLVIFNNQEIPALSGAVAYESTVRSSGTGYGTDTRDDGRQYGSASRLQAVLNLGNLSQYPADTGALVPARAAAGDTPLTVIGHEAGHLFLARASVRDPADPTAQPMLGYQNAHWSFLFNSEASLLEGERIFDKGPDSHPRFLTTDTVQGYAPLDQYLMGFRAPADVPDTFMVTGAPAYLQTAHPAKGVTVDGGRRDITIDEIIRAMGRRTPDSTVAQRRFRFAFLLVIPGGSQPSLADLAKLDAFRQQFEAFFSTAASGNATAETSLRRSLKLSLFPASGVVSGGSAGGMLTLQTPATANITVNFAAPNGNAIFPASVTIPAGATAATFSYTGAKAGVEPVAAVSSDPSYESAFARVQVADASILRLNVITGDHQIANTDGTLREPIVVRVTDSNGLRYPGVRVVANASAGGSVTPAAVLTSSAGLASFTWTPGAAGSNQLRLSVEALPSVAVMVEAGAAVPVASAIVNAASFESGLAAGAIQTIFGANLAGGQTAIASGVWPTSLSGVLVSVNGAPVPLIYVSDTQINFYLPADTPLGDAAIAVLTPSGSRASINAAVVAVQPGIFPGGVLHAGTTVSAVTSAVQAGEFIEIYCTGLGATQVVDGLANTVSTPTVFFGGTPVKPAYSGLAPGYSGLYQINVQVPVGLPPGMVPLIVSIDLTHSNEVQIAVR